MASSVVFPFNDKYLDYAPESQQKYTIDIKSRKVPLIIDNGSFQCRAGWASDENPLLVFRNIVAKQRGKKEMVQETYIGNDISNIEVVRWMLKSHFDRDVVVNWEIQEQVFDHLFCNLGIQGQGSMDHPIVLTEAVCNPNYSRQLMSELLFECYHVPSLATGVDCLYSLYDNRPESLTSDGLILSSGYQITHILPFINGQLDMAQCRRINIGGAHSVAFLHRLLQLKYHRHFAAINLSRSEEMLEQHCYLAKDFCADLSHWGDQRYYNRHVHKLQLPYTPLPDWSTGDQSELRKQRVQRLQEMNIKRREQKLAADQEKLHLLTGVLGALKEEDDEDANWKLLEEVGFSSAEDISLEVTKLIASVQKVKGTMRAEDSKENISLIRDGTDYDLLGIPDTELSSEMLEKKKRQQMLKSIQDTLSRAKRVREENRNRIEEGLKLLEGKHEEEFQKWLQNVISMKQEIISDRKVRHQRKTNQSKRGSIEAQERMKRLAHLAQDTKQKDDTFGLNDDDWDVYKEVSRDAGDSDSEAEQEKLLELDQILQDFDPNYEKETKSSSSHFDLAEYYQLQLGSERIRAPEILFQPSMLGLDQAGLAETLEFILSKYSLELQNRLVQNVFITGGNLAYPGTEQRIKKELLEMRPFQSTFQVFTAANPVLDAWHGARKWASDPDKLVAGSVSRSEYEEKGCEYLKEHIASNVFLPNPR